MRQSFRRGIFMSRSKIGVMFAASWLIFPTSSAHAYVDMAPTLGRIVREARVIAVAEVDQVNLDKGVVILKRVRDLKGEFGVDPVKHQVRGANDSGLDRPILDWAERGSRCVVFLSGNTTLVCLGRGWYQAHSSGDGWWRLGAARPDLPLAYYGTVSRLTDAIGRMLDNQSAIITTLPHGASQEGASFDLALNRASLPGLVKVQRLRAHLGMPPMVMAVSANPAFLVGMGLAGEDEIPALREKLRASDATVRAESAADLGSLGKKAAGAAGDLSQRLDDASPRVRMAAAAALLRVAPGDARAREVLARGLASDDPGVRRHAACAVGWSGPAAAPLAVRLGDLLRDPDLRVRRTALQAIATLGPAAAEALDGLIPLVNDPQTAIDAADALGRLGPAARPALKSLTPLLTAEAPAERWAAVRAMAQIGGDGAAPAVEFIIRALPRASDVESYNMLIYLALLGPVARDAIPAIRTARVGNPVLRQTTIWAIAPGADLPWLGPIGDADFARWILESYVQELGDHLKPAAAGLARKIMAGTAGNVPGWGYKLLARFRGESLALLVPGLEDKDLVVRERAAVALGYLGPAAAAARPQVARALERTQDEREQLLLKWCLREIDRPAVGAGG
jgi:HEAT repeat protein